MIAEDSSSMSRSPGIALWFALFLAIAGLAWLTARPTRSCDPAGMARRDTSRLPDPRATDADVGIEAVPEETRREVGAASQEDPPPGDEAQPAIASRGLVRVHGQVRRSGRPVASYDLVFQAMGNGVDERDDDWDFTGEDGRYEVELRAASYVVLNDDEGPWVTNVTVPEGQDELVLDIDLPVGG